MSLAAASALDIRTVPRACTIILTAWAIVKRMQRFDLFIALQVDLFGRQIWEREVGFKSKTYSFFYATDGIACARSSAGTLTLMKALRS